MSDAPETAPAWLRQGLGPAAVIALLACWGLGWWGVARDGAAFRAERARAQFQGLPSPPPAHPPSGLDGRPMDAEAEAQAARRREEEPPPTSAPPTSPTPPSAAPGRPPGRPPGQPPGQPPRGPHGR